MRDLTEDEINKYRDREWEQRLLAAQWEPFDLKDSGCFWIPSRGLGIIAAKGGGWDHISVQKVDRKTKILLIPSWLDMDYCKRLFFKPDETAMQLHVAESDHINIRPNCLHIWRPQGFPIPLPPKEYV